jgi:hypothetical protein
LCIYGRLLYTGSFKSYLKLTLDSLRNKIDSTAYVLGEIVDRASSDLGYTLTQDNDSEITKALAYYIREMIRNTFEHAKTDSVWICGQYWPQRHRTEIAILDEGCGIRGSLEENPRFQVVSDNEANKLALQPGVSKMVGKRQDPDDIWQNSGYGLYAASSLCTIGGYFVLASGQSATVINSGKEKDYKCDMPGTAVCLSLDTTRISNLSQLLRRIIDAGTAKAKKYGKERIITASKVSSIASILGNISDEDN